MSPIDLIEQNIPEYNRFNAMASKDTLLNYKALQKTKRKKYSKQNDELISQEQIEDELRSVINTALENLLGGSEGQ